MKRQVLGVMELMARAVLLRIAVVLATCERSSWSVGSAGAMRNPDDNLMELARAGDRRALNELIRRELPSVRRSLRRWLGPRQDLDDLVQTVFIEFCGALEKYRGESRISAFVHGYAKIVALRAKRPSAWDRRRCPLSFEPLSNDAGQQSTTVAREQIRRLYHALSRISEAKRTAFVLWAFYGKTPEEIASQTGTSVAAVRSRIFYAQKELRKKATRDPYLRELLKQTE